jgi:flagellar hook-associated protein 2
MSSSLAVTGLASGVDWSTLISSLAEAERTPETQWKASQTIIDEKNSAFTVIKNYLSTLQTSVQALKQSTLYTNRTATASDSTIATATANSGTANGSYSFNISQLATTGAINGTSGISSALSSNGDIGSVTIGTAGLATSITAGTFTINGKQVTISTTDSLQNVFDAVATATAGPSQVTATYSNDKITLTSADGSTITLGSTADTSNFLSVTKLYNNSSGTITSTGSLGRVLVSASMSNSNLSTAITDGGSGNGQFTINGVNISYNASSDNIQNVLDRINSSAAGVTATYDSQNNRFVLTNNFTGDLGISLQDVTGNFLAATGLSGGTLSHGNNLLYTLNGGSEQLVSNSNTISGGSSGINGLSITALKTGSVSVAVATDTSSITSAIQSFVTAYNTVQSYISGQASTTTDSSGKVTAGLLTGDRDAANIADSLRSLSLSESSNSNLPSYLNQLADIGIVSNGQDNTITLDSTTLSSALSNNLNSVVSLLTDSTNGVGAKLDSYITNTISDSGSLINHQATLSKQSTSINDQITALEKTITADTARWTSEFQTMEQVQAQVNQEISYLSQQVTNWGKS